MISDSLVLHLVLAFAVGCVWVPLVAVISERTGNAGGILGGLPSTSALSFLFIGFNRSSDAAVQATAVFPLAFSFTCAFLLFYAFFAKRGFRVGLSISLLMWFVVSSLIVIFNFKNFALSLVVGVLVLAAIYYAFAERLDLKSFPPEERHYTVLQHLGRGVLAGSIVLLAVITSQIGGPVLGGVFSSFPAVFTSTLFIVNKSQGDRFFPLLDQIISGFQHLDSYSIRHRSALLVPHSRHLDWNCYLICLNSPLGVSRLSFSWSQMRPLNPFSPAHKSK